jgi:ADP-ribose pyrophosphatase
MPPKPWKTLTSSLVYENPWIKVREDVAELPDGKTTLYGVVEVGHAVGILPLLDTNQVVLVRQYRYVFGENQRWEMPTGGVLPGEGLLEAAQRELQEEVGYQAAELRTLSTFYSSKSVMYEIAHLYLGSGLTNVQALPEETEFLEVGVFPFEKVLRMVVDSEIRDVMTTMAVLMVERLRQDGKG